MNFPLFNSKSDIPIGFDASWESLADVFKFYGVNPCDLLVLE